MAKLLRSRLLNVEMKSYNSFSKNIRSRTQMMMAKRSLNRLEKNWAKRKARRE